MWPKISLETKIFLSIAVGTLLIIFGAAFILGKNNNKPADKGVLVRNSSHFLGSESAKVTIVEFSDFECPACVAAQPTVKQIIANYQDKIRFVYREFPLPNHEFGLIAAKAAEAAGLQGKFWEMHDKLFEKSPALSKEQIITCAQEIGLDIDKFNQDFDSEIVSQIIAQDQADGNSAGLSATPTFFINGTKFTGGLSFEQFQQEIEARWK